MLESTREAVRQTDTYVHENPWNAMGAAASVGLLVGFSAGSTLVGQCPSLLGPPAHEGLNEAR
jgi:hypothetical protein